MSPPLCNYDKGRAPLIRMQTVIRVYYAAAADPLGLRPKVTSPPSKSCLLDNLFFRCEYALILRIFVYNLLSS